MVRWLILLCAGEEEKRLILDQLKTWDSFNDIHHIEDGGTEGHHDLKMLSFASIVESTNNFSLENKLGEGGFGPVYKVTSNLVEQMC